MAEEPARGQGSAKLIVAGEHFVVTGSAALAIPLPELKTEVSLTPHARSLCVLDPSLGSLGFGADAQSLMEKALRAAATRFGWDLDTEPLLAFSVSNFPCSRGLGSSASFSVALARAFSRLRKNGSYIQRDIQTEAQQIENIFHGKSSGLDTAVIQNERPILYRNGRVLKTFSLSAVDFVVADSGPRDACSALVSRSLEMRNQEPELWRSLSDQATRISEECCIALADPKGASAVADWIKESQSLLARIGLMNEGLDRLLNLGKKAGALAGKMSGAGSGGIALFVTPPGDGQRLARNLNEAGASVITHVRTRVLSAGQEI